MRLLNITETGQGLDEFDRVFEETENISIEQVSPRVVNREIDVDIQGESVKDYNAAFLQIPTKNAIFGRVLLEIMEEHGLELNYSSTAFFTMAKKNYLYYVLHEKNVESPKTVSVASEKATRNIDQELKFPVIGRKFDNLEEMETSKLEDMEEVKEFAEGIEYEENILLFQKSTEGEKYRVMVAGDTVISLVDESDGWKIGKENLKYSTLPKNLVEKVRNTQNVIGTSVAEVLLKGEKVIDVNPNPDLQTYTEISGKNAYEAVAEELKE